MSSQAALRVPLWAERYLPDFAALLRIVERAEHFFLQPVETPSPDLARALAGWLQGQGWQVRVIEVEGEAGWLGLAEALEAAPEAGQRRVVVVIAPYDLDGELLRTALARVNLQRDAIVRAMDCPLLWCGTRAFARSTWEYAADFWSIASTPYRIPIKHPMQARRDDSMAEAWWTGAASEDVAALEAAFSQVCENGPDSDEAVTLGLRLAECQLAGGELFAAEQVLAKIRLRMNPAFGPRWGALHDAVMSEIMGTGASIAPIRSQISEASARGATRTEARLRLELAARMRFRSGAGSVGEVRAELLRARALFADIGDALAVLKVDENLVLSDESPPLELMDEMVANAERFLSESRDLSIREIASLVLAQVSRWQQRFKAAEDMLDSVLAEGVGEGTNRYLAMLFRRGQWAREAQDWPLAYDLGTKILSALERGQLLGVKAMAHFDRGVACVSMGRSLNAAADFLASARIAEDLDEHGAAFNGLKASALAAKSLGIAQVGAVLAIRAVREFLRLLSTRVDSTMLFYMQRLAEVGDTQVAERIDALGRWVAEVKPTLSAAEVQAKLAEFEHEFAAMLEAREAELRVEGIDAMDPLTWGVSEEPPVGRSQG